jgi:hypothetical protein
MMPRLLGSFAILLSGLLLASASPALATTDGTWEMLLGEPPETPKPPEPPTARRGHSAIYDPVRDRVVVFGGYGNGYLNDVWVSSSGDTLTWTRLAPAGVAPGARANHRAIYDPVRDRMVVFGGYQGGYLNDVWALSLSGTPTWTQLTPAGTLPAVRSGHGAIYDPVRDRMVIFGGLSSVDIPVNDVWALSLGEAPVWTALTPTGTLPRARAYHSAVYDPVRDRIVVFGGYSPFYYFHDVWELSLAGTPSWTELAPTGTPPSAWCWSHIAIYDPAGDRMVVFGGYSGSAYLGETWELSLAGTPAWTELAPEGASPSARREHSAVYDPVRHRMVVFGGFDGTLLDDVWTLSLSNPLAWSGPVTPPPPEPRPVARFWHTAIYDPVGDRMVVFGGTDFISTDDTVWELSLSGAPQWRAMTPDGTAPVGRLLHSAIYDPIRRRMIMLGGADAFNPNPSYSDVWALSLADPPAWSQLSPAGVPPGGMVALRTIYDPVRDRVVVFGDLGHVWTLTLGDTPTWAEITPPCTTRFDCPGERPYCTAIYDPTGDRMLIYGGQPDILSDPGELWALSLSGTPAWTELQGSWPWLNAGPLAHSAIRDPVRERMVVFGGQEDLAPENTVAAFSPDATSAWTWLAPGGSPPPPRMGHTAVYDPVRDRMVVFGGLGVRYFADTWALTWGEPIVPTQLALVSAEAEPDRVRLTWYAAQGGAVRATVYRRTEATEWAAIGEVAADGTGQLVYEDRGVTPGVRYGYRLGVVEDGAETYLGEAWVDVPLAAGLALSGAHPNPATAELRVAFSLPDAAPARLEAFDLAGRRVAAQEVGAMGAGSHVVNLGEGARLGCGVYVVRLTQGERSLVTRAVVVR